MGSHAEVLRADAAFFGALVRAQAGELDTLLTDDFSLADLSGVLMSKVALTEAVRSRRLVFEAIEPGEAAVRFYRLTAIVTGRTAMRGRFDRTAFVVQSRYTHVYVERDGKLYLAAAQGTPIVSGQSESNLAKTCIGHDNANDESTVKDRSDNVPIACSLTSTQLRNREAMLIAQFRSTVIQTEEIEEGYAFRLPGDGKSIGLIAELIVAERECCPFLTFGLTVQPNAGQLILLMTGPSGTKEFVKGVFLQSGRAKTT